MRVLRHPGGANRGLVASLNLALTEARGELLARMDADDRSYPERFERQVAFLDAHPDVGVVGCRADSFDGVEQSVWGEFTTADLIRWHVLFTTPLPGAVLILRRRVVEQVGGYDASAEHAEDYRFLLDLSRVTLIRSLPEPLYYYRRDVATSVSRTHRARQFETYREIQRDAHRDYGVAPISHMASAFLFSLSLEETERTFGPVRLAEAREIVRALNTLRRAFVRRWAPSSADRREVDQFVRWRVRLLTAHLRQQQIISESQEKLLRLVWDPKGTFVHTSSRLLARLRN